MWNSILSFLIFAFSCTFQTLACMDQYGMNQKAWQTEEQTDELMTKSNNMPLQHVQLPPGWEANSEGSCETAWKRKLEWAVIVGPYEPCHEKTCFCHMRTTKAQISLRIHPVWSAPLLFAAQIVWYVYLLIQSFKTLASLCPSAGWFESYLVANPEDSFVVTRLIW